MDRYTIHNEHKLEGYIFTHYAQTYMLFYDQFDYVQFIYDSLRLQINFIRLYYISCHQTLH